jgi:hypothetical protein
VNCFCRKNVRQRVDDIAFSAGSFSSGRKVQLIRLGKPPKQAMPLDLISHDLARIYRLFGTTPLSTSAVVSISADDRTWDQDQFTTVLGFGDPIRHQKVMFDTASDFSWIRCNWKDNNSAEIDEGVRYAPSDSKSSKLTTCRSPTCYEAGGYCISNADYYCSFSTRYMDSSNRQGTILTDTLTLTPSVSVNNFIFGCASSDPEGQSGGADGLIGLGRGATSLAQQIYPTLQNGFSYCIPSTNNNKTGFLTFGRMDEPSTDITFTEMFRHRTHTSLYFVDLTDIYIGDESIPVQKEQETFVDSGTMFTYIPPEVHAKLTTIFRREFQEYLIPDNASRFNGCFNFTDAPDRIYIPQVTFSFNDGAQFNLGVDGTLYKPMLGGRIACLAFQPQEGISMIGRLAQQSIEVVYDTNNAKLGFGISGSC